MSDRDRRWRERDEARKRYTRDLADLGLLEQLGQVNLSTVSDWGWSAGFDPSTAYRVLLWLGVARIYKMTEDERFICRAISGTEFAAEDPSELPF